MTHPTAYLPIHTLNEDDIRSMISIAFPILDDDEARKKYDYHHSRRTMLYFLKSIYETPNSQRIKDLIAQQSNRNINLEAINEKYKHLKLMPEPYQEQNRGSESKNYWELKLMNRSGARKSYDYISKFRKDGFLKNELKLYWNYKEIETLVEDTYNRETDEDAHNSLKESPVSTRENSGRIEFIQDGIENAVFKVPTDKQVIVLDFADERMPGGYFLENARTQEEVILYNSDGYRALLDLKYQVMDGGYILPEYGVAYIKNVRFFQNSSSNGRLTDLIVGACYDLSGMGEGLYKPPSFERKDELRDRTKKKFQAVIASAVANTYGSGKHTYLLLGPIGTGAFGNDVKMIAEIFSEILNGPLMNSGKPIKKAFEAIWFVSIDSLDQFQTYMKASI